VKQNRESRTLMCVSQYAMLEAIIEFLREECCVNSKIA
ncbi:transcriptional regulator, partial [Escherichia coli]|nr:transcriptional regulator [Escherichia coli]